MAEMNEIEEITVCAFNDYAKHSKGYRSFKTIEEAEAFYGKMLRNKNVHVVSTRIIRKEAKKN